MFMAKRGVAWLKRGVHGASTGGARHRGLRRVRASGHACTLHVALTSAPFSTRRLMTAGCASSAAHRSGETPCAPAVIGCRRVGGGSSRWGRSCHGRSVPGMWHESVRVRVGRLRCWPGRMCGAGAMSRRRGRRGCARIHKHTPPEGGTLAPFASMSAPLSTSLSMRLSWP
jgi:hypothetical protein